MRTMEIEDWIICETLHTVTDLNDFIELHNGEWWTIKQIRRWKLLRGQHTTAVRCRFQNAKRKKNRQDLDQKEAPVNIFQLIEKHLHH